MLQFIINYPWVSSLQMVYWVGAKKIETGNKIAELSSLNPPVLPRRNPLLMLLGRSLLLTQRAQVKARTAQYILERIKYQARS